MTRGIKIKSHNSSDAMPVKKRFLQRQKHALTAETQPGYMFAQSAVVLTQKQFPEQAKLHLCFYGGGLRQTK